MSSDSTLANPTPASEPGVKPKKPRVSIGDLLKGILFYLLELILPAGIAAGFLWWLSGYVRLWDLNRVLALAVFSIVLVILSFILCILLDKTFLRLAGHPFGITANPRGQVVTYALAGILIPAALLIAANLTILPSGKTPISFYIQTTMAQLKLTTPDLIGKTILSSENTAARVLGIQSLQSLHSPDALSQLILLVSEDQNALRNAGEYTALSQAIASYGADAKKPLLDIFAQVDPSKRSQSGSLQDDLFTRYFAQSFDSLKADIQAQTPGKSAQDLKLAQLDAAAANLKASLNALTNQNLAAAGGDPRLDFVIRTFLAMDLTQDKDLLAFARTVAAETSFSPGVRGDALLLTAKLGSKDDLDFLYSFLSSGDEILKEKTFAAIVTLQNKLTGAPKSTQP